MEEELHTFILKDHELYQMLNLEEDKGTQGGANVTQDTVCTPCSTANFQRPSSGNNFSQSL